MGKSHEYSKEELLPVVAKLAERYMGYEHTSITYERAQMLMEAVIYCIKELEQSEETGQQEEVDQQEEVYQRKVKKL